MQRTRDFTQGPPLRLILSFSLPMMAGRIFEQLYNLTDTVVLGRLEGVAALTAVSAAGWLDWLIFSVLSALAEGISLYTAQRFGARDTEGLKNGIGQGVRAMLITALALTLFGQVALQGLLRLLRSPEETFALSERYLRVLFAGILPVSCYLLLSGLLRAMGNSRAPFAAMVVASLSNMGLDILFVGAFRMGVAGAALATVIAQGISAVLCLVTLLKIPEARISGKHLRRQPQVTGQLLKLSAPVCLGNLIISLGGLVVQRTVNTLGLVFMAGFNAGGRLSGIMEMAGGALGSGIAAYSGQNKGAGRYDRIEEGVRKTALVTVLIAAALSLCVHFFVDPLLRLFIEDDPALVEQVLAISKEYLLFIECALPGLYLLFVFRSALQGMGDTMLAMISGGVEMVMRIGVILILPGLIGYTGVYFSEVSAWIGAAVYLYIAYKIRLRYLKNAAEKNSALPGEEYAHE